MCIDVFNIVPIHFTKRYGHGIFAAGRAKCPHKKKKDLILILKTSKRQVRVVW